MRGIEAQFLALQKGFNELIPQHLLRPFDEKELEVSALFHIKHAEMEHSSWRNNFTEFNEAVLNNKYTGGLIY